jgi:hypothetical protein
MGANMGVVYKIINFLKTIFFGNKELPDVKTPEDVVCLVDLLQCINKFRLDNGLLPYFYMGPLEDIAQEIANNNYKDGILNTYVDVSSMSLKFRMKGIPEQPFALIVLEKSTADVDFCHKLLVGQANRHQLLDGFMNKIGMAKCGNYIAIILTK